MIPFSFLVPGKLDQVTGGYLYDRRVVEGLRATGREVAVIELAGHYPEADAAALAAMAAALAALPDGAAAVIDGLALPGAAECLAAAAARLRIVGFVHHPLALETGLTAAGQAHFAALEARLLPLLRGVICPSAATARAVVAYGVPPSRVAVVPPGTAKPAAIPVRNPGRTQRLLSVAAVTPRKGHVLLIEALADLTQYDWHLLCIGSTERDPAAASALREAIARRLPVGRVTLAGERLPDSLADAYAAADCFVLPSYHEGYGMAFAEALAHGLPVIATTGGAIPDTVPASAGLLVPPGDAAALRDALRRFFTDAALRRALASGARAAGAALSDWNGCVAAWGAAFDRLAA